MQIHQLVVGASPGDAITSMALAIQRQLRQLVRSDIFARHVDPTLSGRVRPLTELASVHAGRRDLLLYHASIGEPTVTSVLVTRPERLVVLYHNITPAELVLPVDPHVAALLGWGRTELAIIRPRVELAVADSRFNARDLEALGYENVHVVPVGVDPNRLLTELPDPTTRRLIDDHLGDPYILGVSQFLPHKRHELLIEAVFLLRSVLGIDAALVLVGAHRLVSYAAAVAQLAARLGLDRVHLAGGVPDRVLATYFQRAALYATASRHEGLAVPPLEAMAFGVPVVAIGNGALPDTVAAGGLVLPSDAGAIELAEAMAVVLEDKATRDAMVLAGTARLADFDADAVMARFLALLAGVI